MKTPIPDWFVNTVSFYSQKSSAMTRDDLLSEVVLNLFEKRGWREIPLEPSAYHRQAVRWSVSDQLRKERRIIAPLLPLNTNDPGYFLTSTTRPFERHIDHRRTLRELQRRTFHLSSPERQLLEFKILRDIPDKAIAKHLGLSLRTFYRRWRRIKQLLSI